MINLLAALSHPYFMRLLDTTVHLPSLTVLVIGEIICYLTLALRCVRPGMALRWPLAGRPFHQTVTGRKKKNHQIHSKTEKENPL